MRWLGVPLRWVLVLTLLGLILFRGRLARTDFERCMGVGRVAWAVKDTVTAHDAFVAAWPFAATGEERAQVLYGLHGLGSVDALLHLARQAEGRGQTDSKILTLLLGVQIRQGLPPPETPASYEVERLINGILEQDPKNVFALWARAYLLYQRVFTPAGRPEDVIRSLRDLLEREPANERGTLMLARLLIHAGRMEEAEQLRASFTARSAESGPEGGLVSAEINAYLHRLDRVLADLERVAQKFGSDDVALMRASALYEMMGQYDKSVVCLKTVMDRRPDDVEPVARLVTAMTRMKQYAGAIELGDATCARLGAAARTPQTRDWESRLRLRLGLCRLALTQEQPERRDALVAAAREDLGKALDRPEDAWLRDLLSGLISLSAGRGAEGISLLERAAVTAPIGPDLLFLRFTLAQALVRENQFQRALEMAGEALRLSPTAAPALVAQTEALMALGRFEEAERAAEQLVALKADEPRFQQLLTTALLKQGRDAEFQKSAARTGISPDSSRMILLLERARRSSPDEAEGILREILKDPGAEARISATAIQILAGKGLMDAAAEWVKVVRVRHPQDLELEAMHTMVEEKDLARRAERLAAMVRRETTGFAQAQGLVRVYWSHGRTDEAEAALKECLRLQPNHRSSHELLFQISLSKGHWDLAREQQRSLAELNADGVKGFWYLASMELTRGDLPAADAALKQALVAIPRHSPTLHLRHLLNLRQNNLEQARAALNESLIANPNYLPSLLARGEMLIRAGSYVAAEVDLTRAWEIDHQSLRAAELLVHGASRQKNPEQVLRIVQQAEGRNLFSPSLLRLKVMALLDRGEFAGAGHALRDWIRIATRPALVLDEFNGEFLTRPTQERAALLENWLRASERDVIPCLLMANQLLAQLQYDAARPLVAELNARTERVRGLRTFWLRLRAVLVESDKDLGAAETVYRELLSLLPEDLMANNNLAFVLARSGRADEGLQYVRACVKAHAQLPVVWDTLGAVLLAAGQLEQADEALKESLKRGETASAFLTIGKLRRAQNRPDEARTALETAVMLAEKDGRSPDTLKEAKELLAGKP